MCVQICFEQQGNYFLCTSISAWVCVCVYSSFETRSLRQTLCSSFSFVILFSFFFVLLLSNSVLLFNSFVLGILKLLDGWNAYDYGIITQCSVCLSICSLLIFLPLPSHRFSVGARSQLIHLEDSARTFYFESTNVWVVYPIFVSSHFLSSSSYHLDACVCVCIYMCGTEPFSILLEYMFVLKAFSIIFYIIVNFAFSIGF